MLRGLGFLTWLGTWERQPLSAPSYLLLDRLEHLRPLPLLSPSLLFGPRMEGPCHPHIKVQSISARDQCLVLSPPELGGWVGDFAVHRGVKIPMLLEEWLEW